MNKITVALSVYNVDDFIRKSLDCIIRQTFDDVEVLCIDDASTDETISILEEYENRDNRVKLIRNTHNQGLSVSRNIAIEEARGEYIIMLDGDDLFAPDMLEKAYWKAKETDADMVMWDYAVFKEEKEIEKEKIKLSSLVSISPSDKISLLRRPAFTWVRLLKVDTIKKLNIRFTPGLTKQDIPFHWKLVTSLDKISIIPEHLSFYRQQPFSTTNRKDKSVFSLAYVMDIVKQQLLADGIYNEYKNEFLRSRLSLLQGMYDVVQKQLKEDALTLVKERLGADELLYLEDPNNQLTKRVRSFYGMIQGDTWSTISYKGTLLMRDIYRMIKRI